MGGNKKRRKPYKKDTFENPSAEDYQRGKTGLIVFIVISVLAAVGLVYLYS
ncbi:MAG: hypothetical protein ACPGJV_13875 [Bacteriovoracaceae bacterium]